MMGKMKEGREKREDKRGQRKEEKEKETERKRLEGESSLITKVIIHHRGLDLRTK